MKVPEVPPLPNVSVTWDQDDVAHSDWETCQGVGPRRDTLRLLQGDTMRLRALLKYDLGELDKKTQKMCQQEACRRVVRDDDELYELLSMWRGCQSYHKAYTNDTELGRYHHVARNLHELQGHGKEKSSEGEKSLVGECLDELRGWFKDLHAALMRVVREDTWQRDLRDLLLEQNQSGHVRGRLKDQLGDGEGVDPEAPGLLVGRRQLGRNKRHQDALVHVLQEGDTQGDQPTDIISVTGTLGMLYALSDTNALVVQGRVGRLRQVTHLPPDWTSQVRELVLGLIDVEGTGVLSHLPDVIVAARRILDDHDEQARTSGD